MEDSKLEYVLADSSEIELGKSYPVYGMVTKILEEDDTSIEVEINYNIKVTLPRISFENKEKLKSRAWEAGIFVMTFNETYDSNREYGENDYPYQAECTTVMFNAHRRSAEA